MSYVAAGIAAAQIGSSLIGGSKARKAAKKAAKAQASLTREMRDEEIRQKRAANRQELGLAKAQVYASNILFSGSSKSYVEAMDVANMREIAFAERAKDMEYKAIRKGGNGAGSALFGQAATQALQYAADAYSNRSQSTPATTTEIDSVASNPLAASAQQSYNSEPGGGMQA